VTQRPTLLQPDRRTVSPSTTGLTKKASASSPIPAPIVLSAGSVACPTFRRSASRIGTRFASSSFDQHTFRQQDRLQPNASPAIGPYQRRFESSAGSPPVRQTCLSGHQQRNRRATRLTSRGFRPRNVLSPDPSAAERFVSRTSSRTSSSRPLDPVSTNLDRQQTCRTVGARTIESPAARPPLGS
jgi:hypothetical protein